MSEDPTERLNAALEGRYKIERQLGEGGMATVYLADDLKHDRKVALKVLKPELGAIVGAERFLGEIKVTAKLQHPNILPLHDSGEADKLLFYVMPHVEGESLRERLDREKQLPVDEAVKIVTEVADALHTAHAQGVIHRDIKPANILMSRGRPLIADFGIALAVSVAGGGRLTETGLSVGTPYYMSPEQAAADREVSPASDVYSLACVLYEMLVGEPPHTGPSAQAVLAKILTDVPTAPHAARATVPANVDAAIRKALEKLPADRFTGAQEFARALADPGFRHADEEAEAVAVPVVGPWKRVSVAMTATTVLFAGAFGWALLRPKPPAALARFEVMLGEDRGLPPNNVTGVDCALSPDGSRLVYVGVAPDGGTQLWQRALDDLEPDPISGTEGAIAPVLSPDGLSVTFSDLGRSKKTVSLRGGPPFTVVAEGQATRTSAWGSDGMIYFGLDEVIYRVPATGGEPEAVTSPTDGPQRFPDALPDGRGLLLTVHGGSPEQSRIAVVGPEGGEVRELFQGTMARYAASGHVVYATADGTLMAAPFDLKRLEVTGPSVALLEGVQVEITSASQFALSQTGTLLYLAGGSGATPRRQLVVADLEGNEEPLVLAPREIGSVGWSPDGQSVVYSSDGQIYTYNVALGTTPRQLTFEGINRNPVFSPDGTRIAFDSEREGTDGFDLFVKILDDDSAPRSIITLDANQFVTQWPSDTLIVFERGEGGVRDLWTVDLSDPENPQAEDYVSSEADLRYMVVSPDGTLAAYTSNETGPYEIYIRSFPEPGERTIVSEGGGGIPFWSPDGSILYYTRPPGIFTAARLERDPVPVVVSRDSLFTTRPGGVRPFQGSGLHPDGDRFILARSVGSADAEGESTEPDRLILVLNFFEVLKERVGG